MRYINKRSLIFYLVNLYVTIQFTHLKKDFFFGSTYWGMPDRNENG